MELLECEDCLVLDETVAEVVCPYAEAIKGKKEIAILCTDCFGDRVAEI